MNVALVLYGQPRFVESKVALKSHKKYLLHEEFDSFGHMWTAPKGTSFTASSWSNINDKGFNENAIRLIQRFFPSIALEEELTSGFSDRYLSMDFHKTIRFTAANQNLYNAISQMYSIHKALNKVKTSQKKYELVILSRFDQVIHELPPLKSIDSEKLNVSDLHPRFPDTLLIGKPELIYATDAFPIIDSILQDLSEIVAEEIKKKAFLKFYNESYIKQIPMKTSLIRSGERIEILKLQLKSTIPRLFSS